MPPKPGGTKGRGRGAGKAGKAPGNPGRPATAVNKGKGGGRGKAKNREAADNDETEPVDVHVAAEEDNNDDGMDIQEEPQVNPVPVNEVQNDDEGEGGGDDDDGSEEDDDDLGVSGGGEVWDRKRQEAEERIADFYEARLYFFDKKLEDFKNKKKQRSELFRLSKELIRDCGPEYTGRFLF